MVTSDYDFELDNVASKIRKSNAKSVIIQLPDGLKTEATKIADSLRCVCPKVYIWAGSCFGFCDIPNVKNVGLLVQFGHNAFRL